MPGRGGISGYRYGASMENCFNCFFWKIKYSSWIMCPDGICIYSQERLKDTKADDTCQNWETKGAQERVNDEWGK